MIPLVRDAREDDLPRVLAIYNDAVLHSTAIWNETPTTLEARRIWHEARVADGYPVLVAVAGDVVVGYGTFADFRPFEGYRHTVEHSLYVEGSAQRRGVGRALLDALVDRASTLGKHAMIGGIEGGNGPSLQLHRRAGFVEVGRLPEVGRKFGRWLDLVFMQKTLGSPTA